MIGYATWLALGLPMLLVYLLAAAFIVLPNEWLGAGEDWQRVADNLWYSTDGVFGRPVEVVGRTVLVFIVFGAVLQTSGAGAVAAEAGLRGDRAVRGRTGARGDCRIGDVRHHVGGGGGQCRFHRRLHHSHHQARGLSGPVCRRGGGGGVEPAGR